MRSRFINATFFVKLFLIVLLTSMSTLAMATGGAPDVPEFVDFDPDNLVPIDGGASLLIAAGVAYGLKKIHDKRKQSNTDIS